MGVLAGSRIGIPGNSRKKLLSALLVPQETLAGTSRWPAALARAGKLAATHRRIVSKKRRRNEMANTAMGTTLPGITHHRSKVNGTELHYVAAGTGGSPILLVHGFPETWWTFRKLIPLLASTHRVFAVDLRGFGDSANKPGATTARWRPKTCTFSSTSS